MHGRSQDLADLTCRPDLADLDLADLDLADLRRWAVCAAVVVLAYGGIAAGMVAWHEDDGGAEPAAAIVIEMALVSVTPGTPEDIAPGPPQRASQASPNKPVESLDDKEKSRGQAQAEGRGEHRNEAARGAAAGGGAGAQSGGGRCAFTAAGGEAGDGDAAVAE